MSVAATMSAAVTSLSTISAEPSISFSPNREYRAIVFSIVVSQFSGSPAV
jgi:hypothetical protein